MVETRVKKIFHFTIFILPCFILYTLFFIYPFFKGIGISFTNWDGLTPKSPVSISKVQFETDILPKLTEKQQEFLLSIYTLNSLENTYGRLAVGGFVRAKIENIFKKAGYIAERNRFVGLDNYKQIFSGKVDKSFYPHIYTEYKYIASAHNELKDVISKIEFEKEILEKISNDEKTLLLSYYDIVFDSNKNKEIYRLKDEYDEFNIENFLWNLPEVVDLKTVSEENIEKYAFEIKKTAVVGDFEKMNRTLDAFLSENPFSSDSVEKIEATTHRLFKIGEVKQIIGSVWFTKKINMGVIGFTFFFTIFSVIGINLVAFLLALALDSGITGQKLFRTIFFLPNVLSMIIVALIWSMLFIQVLPAITGVEKWISDSHKTPWLLVLTSIWQGAGYYMIVYLAGLQSIPPDCIEAAVIDGASGWQRFWAIKFPLLLPSITVSLFLTIANALKSFDLIYAMIGSTGYATGTVPFVMDIYYNAYAQKMAGLATAKAMILFSVIFLVTGLQLFLMKRKEIEQ